jgi:hypothetical protein
MVEALAYLGSDHLITRRYTHLGPRLLASSGHLTYWLRPSQVLASAAQHTPAPAPPLSFGPHL